MFSNGSIPRPEYPRPDRQRGSVENEDWLNLNGPWQFRFDPQRVGLTEKWEQPGAVDWSEQIIVPFCWESLAAWGEGDSAGNEHYYSQRVFVNPLEVTHENRRTAPRFEVGWYRRSITIPSEGAWRDKRVILTIGAADFFTDCWCNGVHLGRHEGGYVPFEFDLTATLGPSERTALIVIRVEDPMDNREQPVGKQWGWYTTTSGIWQTVFIEPRSEKHIESFRIVPDIDQSEVHFDLSCAVVPDGTQVVVEISPLPANSLPIRLSVKSGAARGSVKLGPLRLWDPDDPKLYQVTFRLCSAKGGILDEVRSYFGMRKISTRPADDADAPGMLCLNNTPIYLRGALYQSYHPAGVYTASDVKTLREDIAFAKEVGFDFLRIHIKLDDPLLLYYADTLGILLMQDFPNFGEGGDTPTGRRRFEEMLRAGIKRDFNHPSIISWCIFNESWGFGGQAELITKITPGSDYPEGYIAGQKIDNTASFAWIHAMWQLAKDLDPTRLIEDMSVVPWDHVDEYGHVDTDINSWHFYIDDYARAKSHIATVVENTFSGSSFNYVEGFSQKNAPLINSEYGGLGALDGDRDISWSFRFLTNELRRHGRLSAYIYTELTDVEWEYNGFLNYDRTRKEFGYSPTLVNQGDVLPIDSPPIQQLKPEQEIAVTVQSSHFSRRRKEKVSLRWILSGIDTLGALHPVLARGNAPISFAHHRVELARVIELKMPIEPMLATLSVIAVAPTGAVIAENFVQYLSVSEPPPLREQREKRVILRARVNDWAEAYWSAGTGGRDEADKNGFCFGEGAGYFEWRFNDPVLLELGHARRVRILVEASARRKGTAQTDVERSPTNFTLLVNDFPVHRALLPAHPHDSRGALSYLRGSHGSYGYFITTTLEGELLRQIAGSIGEDKTVRLRCAVLVADKPRGGLTVYDYNAGRFPFGPTVVIDH